MRIHGRAERVVLDVSCAKMEAPKLKAIMTDLVRRWRDFASATPLLSPLPHPSWRNSGWLKRNPWFEVEVLPILRARVKAAMAPAPGAA